MNRRSLIGLIPTLFIPIPTKATKPMTESSMDPMPKFPLMAVVAINRQRVIKTIPTLKALREFDPDLTQSEIKRLVYQNFTGYTNYDGQQRPYKLATASEITVSQHGTTTWQYWMPSKGDYGTVVF